MSKSYFVIFAVLEGGSKSVIEHNLSSGCVWGSGALSGWCKWELKCRASLFFPARFSLFLILHATHPTLSNLNPLPWLYLRAASDGICVCGRTTDLWELIIKKIGESTHPSTKRAHWGLAAKTGSRFSCLNRDTGLSMYMILHDITKICTWYYEFLMCIRNFGMWSMFRHSGSWWVRWIVKLDFVQVPLLLLTLNWNRSYGVDLTKVEFRLYVFIYNWFSAEIRRKSKSVDFTKVDRRPFSIHGMDTISVKG